MFGDDNLINYLNDVDSQDACSKECENDTSCRFYTYFTRSSELSPQTCVLLTDILAPLKSCKECFTGKLFDDINKVKS